ncbi:POLE4 [Mytilus coruscus]|uniref:POLE4 n=1 Tax=Mytilus coruscus TaxID=42192 RepID=A0A6J8DF84_MYTCO|nr:POLE4 [Mytilus coruscus]
MDQNEKSVKNQTHIISQKEEESLSHAVCTEDSNSESFESVKIASNESPTNVTPPYTSQKNAPPVNTYHSYVEDSAELMQNVSGTNYQPYRNSESEKHISNLLPLNISGAKSEQPNYPSSVRRSAPESQGPNFAENSYGYISYILESEKPISNSPQFNNQKETEGIFEPTSENSLQESISQCSNKLCIALSDEALSTKTPNPTKKLTKVHLPRIRSMMKRDPEVRLVSKEAVVVLAKATELFIEELCKDAMINTLKSTTKRKTLQRKDLGMMLRTIPVIAMPFTTEEKTGEGSSVAIPFGQDIQTDAESVVGVPSSKEQQTYTDSVVAKPSNKELQSGTEPMIALSLIKEQQTHTDSVVPIPFSKDLQSSTEPVMAMSFDVESVKTTKPFKDLQINYDKDMAVGKQLPSAKNCPLSSDLQTGVESLEAIPLSKELQIGTASMVSMPFSNDMQSDFNPIMAMSCNKELQTGFATYMTKSFFGELQHDEDTLLAEPFSTELRGDLETVIIFPPNKKLQNDSD